MCSDMAWMLLTWEERASEILEAIVAINTHVGQGKNHREFLRKQAKYTQAKIHKALSFYSFTVN